MALSIGYGIISCQRPTGSTQTWSEIYADAVALVEAAEAAGFDSAWVTEHHFTADGYLSALFPMLAALAVRTSRITLGTDVILAPLHHPLRLAEDAAAVDCLANGRLLLGLAIGYRDEEFNAMGVPKSQRVARLEEHVEVCRKAWRGEPFSHHGPVVQVNNLVCRPVPPGPPPIWLGAWVDAGVRRAGRIADGYVSPGGSFEDTRRRLDILDGATPHGRRLPMATLHSAWVTDRGPPPSLEAGMAHLIEHYGSWYSSSSDAGGGHAVGEMIRARAANPLAGVICGPASQIIDRLAPHVEAFGRDRDIHMVIRLHYPGQGRTEGLEQIARFAEEVAPALRAAASS